MTQEEATTEPIAKVWGRLRRLIKEGVFTNMEGEQDAHTNEVNARIDSEKAMLRRILLERCKREYNMWINYLWGRYGISIGTTIPGFLHPGEAESWAAALSFMAWELERQTKEQEGGEG